MRRYLHATLSSLLNRNFRLFFVSQTISICGTWMQKVAQALLVLDITGSAFLLGITVGIQEVPVMLFTAWGGVLADRFDKRRILICAQVASSVPAFVLGILTGTGSVRLWMLWVLAAMIGSVEAVEKPARHTFVIEMVGRDSLTNAVALNNITINAGKVIGPAVAGILISTVGMSPCFFLNAASFGVVVFGLLRMDKTKLAQPRPADRARGQVRQGLSYVRGEPILLATLVLLTVAGMLAYNWNVTLPLLGRDVLHGNATQIGLLFTAMGAGAILGSLAIAGILVASVNRLIVSGLVFAAVLGVTAWSPSLVATYVTLVLLGTASIAFRAIASAIVQLWSAPAMRGRTMALLVLATSGTTPIGGPLVGWVAAQWGARQSLALGAVATAVAALATAAYIRRLDDRPAAGAAVVGLAASESTAA